MSVGTRDPIYKTQASLTIQSWLNLGFDEEFIVDFVLADIHDNFPEQVYERVPADAEPVIMP
jgi:hypothetical protein